MNSLLFKLVSMLIWQPSFMNFIPFFFTHTVSLSLSLSLSLYGAGGCYPLVCKGTVPLAYNHIFIVALLAFVGLSALLL